MAREKKIFTWGKKIGQRWKVCAAEARRVRVSTEPPLAETRMSAALVSGSNRMSPAALQEPPRGDGASAMAIGTRPFKSVVFNLPSAKKPRERLSGDQNGKMAP